MAQNLPIEAPAGFVPLHAIGWSDTAGDCQIVDSANPLPVSAMRAAAGQPLAGTAPTTRLVGPYVPVAGRVIYLTLSGTWGGSVRVMRSVDGGASVHPLTFGGQEWGRFTANMCEAIWEEGEDAATLWLACAPTSGVIAYRVSQ